MSTAVVNDAWRDFTEETGYPVAPVSRRRKVQPLSSALQPEKPWHPVARVAARTGAVACYIGAGAWVAHGVGLLG